MNYDHDEDPNDSRQYCKHGTFIGSWWGPDYLCGWCEDGTSDADYALAIARQRVRRYQDRLERIFPTVFQTSESIKAILGERYMHAFTLYLMRQFDENEYEIMETLVQLDQATQELKELELELVGVEQ